MQALYLYLSGSVQKSYHQAARSVFTPADMLFLRENFAYHGFAVHFLSPNLRSDDISDTASVFGRDMLQTYLCDFVLVDARDKRGLGVGYEIAFANSKNIPVIAWSPLGSHYRPASCEILGQSLTNWVHPFVQHTSSCLAQNLQEVIDFILCYSKPNKLALSTDDYVLGAIKQYLTMQLPDDTEMQLLLQQDPKLSDRLQKILGLGGYPMRSQAMAS